MKQLLHRARVAHAILAMRANMLPSVATWWAPRPDRLHLLASGENSRQRRYTQRGAVRDQHRNEARAWRHSSKEHPEKPASRAGAPANPTPPPEGTPANGVAPAKGGGATPSLSLSHANLVPPSGGQECCTDLRSAAEFSEQTTPVAKPISSSVSSSLGAPLQQGQWQKGEPPLTSAGGDVWRAVQRRTFIDVDVCRGDAKPLTLRKSQSMSPTTTRRATTAWYWR